MRIKLIIPTLALCVFSCSEPPKNVEILWDQYRIPHIYSQNTPDLFYAFGWSQAHAHGDLLLRLYGQARGKGAEYWGEKLLKSDTWVWMNSIPQLSEKWAEEQSEKNRDLLQSFLDGINDYANRNPDNISEEMKVVLPVTMKDLMGHALRLIQFTFIIDPDELKSTIHSWPKGSNAWAVGPKRSASGKPLLLANPHLMWGDLFTWFEFHFNIPGHNIYGANLVGSPSTGIMFNENLGWTHTVNTHDGADLYELTLADGGYEFDDDVRSFEIDSVEIQVKVDDSSRTETLVVKRSIHGPVIKEEGNKALALSVVGLDASQIFEERWNMALSSNLEEFEASIQVMQTPMFTIMYADKNGNILHLFGGQTPIRSEGNYDWSGVVPGNTSETLWKGIHTYTDLPRVLNPESGWLQNANDPPWTTTFPVEVEAHHFPGYMAPEEMGFRAQRSARLMDEDEHITFDEFKEYKFSTHMELADRLLDDLLDAASLSRDQKIKEAVRVLEKWDRTSDNASRGSVLFKAWVDDMNFPEDFALQWTPKSPIQRPDGLKDRDLAVHVLYGAAKDVKEKFGRLDVFWGEVFRLKRDELNLPANGAPGDPYGVFRTSYYMPNSDNTQTLIGGDTYVAIIEFGDSIRAEGVIGYGNFSQNGSPHRTDQLKFYSDKQLRPILFYKEDVEKNVVEKTTF